MRVGTQISMSLIVAAMIALGVARAGGATLASTPAIDAAGPTVEVADPAVDPVAKDNPGSGTCMNGAAPRCFRPQCPSATQCPAQDQCYGSYTCATYRTVGGKMACRMLGECSPSSIVISF